MSGASGWEGLLDADETILWQGRPDGTFTWKPRSVALFIFGALFAGFAAFWMLMYYLQSGGYQWTFGLVHFFAGVGLAIGPNAWSAYRRRHSWYSLSNRRAFIATHMPISGKRLKSYSIDEDSVLEFIEGDPASITFATEYRRGKNGSYRVNIGFDRIDDAREVYEMLRKVQRGHV